jgi:hypothetical protein
VGCCDHDGRGHDGVGWDSLREANKPSEREETKGKKKSISQSQYQSISKEKRDVLEKPHTRRACQEEKKKKKKKQRNSL